MRKCCPIRSVQGRITLSSSDAIAPVVRCAFDHLDKHGIDPFEQQFNMRLAQPLSRSVCLNGFATCLRLEEIYWKILERIARANRCSVNAVLSHIDRQVHLRYGGVKNFSGLVRVVCVVHLLEYPVPS